MCSHWGRGVAITIREVCGETAHMHNDSLTSLLLLSFQMKGNDHSSCPTILPVRSILQEAAHTMQTASKV